MNKKGRIFMKIIDLHCDVLYKLWLSKGKLRFLDSPELDANFHRLQQGKVKVQCFAIFIPDHVNTEEKFSAAIKQVHYFKQMLLNNKRMKQILNWRDFFTLKSDEMGAMLTLEGVDCIGNDISKLHILHELGVKSVGLTWNFANLAADGIGEERGAGLTNFGKEIVSFHNEHGILTDVTHLSERAFWDVMEIAKYPIASHSNSKKLCSHPRNLTDDQAEKLFHKNGMVHVVYHPPFITNKEKANISNLIKHIDHFCELGGVENVGLGSDFDGIELHVNNLENSGKQQNLINELLKYYSEEQVKGFAAKNFLKYIKRNFQS